MLIALAVACSSDDSDSTGAGGIVADVVATPTPEIRQVDGETVITLHISSPTGGGQSGSAVLTSSGDQTTVVIDVEPPASDVQPIHIHTGMCGEIGTVIEPLENVIRGDSTTVLKRPLGELAIAGMLINIHASFEDFRTSTACVELPVLNG